MSDMPPPTVPPAIPPPPGGGSYTPPPPPPPGGGYAGGPPASSDRTLMVILSYLGLLALIPFLTKKDDPDIHWHAKNGIGLLILDVVIWAVLFIISMVLRDTLVGCGWGAITCVIWLAVLGLHIFCMIQALNGKRFRVPMVTDFAEKL